MEINFIPTESKNIVMNSIPIALFKAFIVMELGFIPTESKYIVMNLTTIAVF
jgi:hypothetical protein